MDEIIRQRLDSQDRVLEAQNEVLSRIDKKLDAAIEAKTAVVYLKWVLGAAWAAIAALVAHHAR
jgi:hypothetical protein